MRIRISDMPAAGLSLADSLEAEELPQLSALTREGACRLASACWEDGKSVVY